VPSSTVCQWISREVGKRIAKAVVENANSCLVGRGSRLRGVVDEVVGEQRFEQDEIALTLHLFGIATDRRLDGFAFIVC
jgi:hypothetical protein